MKTRYIIGFCGLTLCVCLLAIAGLCIGSVSMTPGQLMAAILGMGEDLVNVNVIYQIRFPRVLAAIFLGGALALAGFLLQTFFRNPIAGPYVLGISSGAKLVVALAMIFLLQRGKMISALGMVAAAFVGAMLAMGFVLALSAKIQKMSMLIVCGILIGYICSAITDFCVTFASDSNIVNLHNWSQGSLSGMNWKDIRIMILVVLVVSAVAFFMAKPISAFMMGEQYARNMGVNISVLKILLIVVSSLLAATVTAFAGPISFVGIAVPHLMKTLMKTAKPLLMIPACFLGGAAVVLFCDIFARSVFAPTELSISSVTAVFLVPVVIFAMLHRAEGRE